MERRGKKERDERERGELVFTKRIINHDSLFLKPWRKRSSTSKAQKSWKLRTKAKVLDDNMQVRKTPEWFILIDFSICK